MTDIRFIHNPILRGMHPDPSWIWDETRGEVALVNSSFELIPGLPVHTTRDFVTWTHVADAVDEDMARRLFLDGVADSGGLYAPTLRRIRGQYVIACTTTRIDRDRAIAAGLGDELSRCDAAGGNFIITADTLEGPWRGPFWVTGAQGIDPDIFEDKDGTIWWTQTRPAVDSHWDGQTEVWTAPLDPDTWDIAGERTVIWRGYGLDAVWAEGPHLYRVGDWVYLMTAEGGTSFDHSEMMMRAFASDGLAAALAGFERDCTARGVVIRPAREGERSVLGEYDRLFRACKRNPVLTHRHLGSAEPVQCIGHADLLHHPDAGWMLTCLGVRQTLDGETGDRRSYLGRETFIAPVRWDYEDVSGSSHALPGEGTDPGWPTVAPGCGRMVDRLRVTVDETGRAMAVAVADATVEEAADDVVTIGDDVPSIRVQAAGGYRFRPVDDMDWSGAIMPGDVLMLRQDTRHYITVEVKTSQNGPIAVVHRVDGDEPAWDQFALRAGEAVGLRLHGNRLDVLALPLEALPDEGGAFLHDVVPGARSRTLHSYDARFLSTEHAGGFVGCLAGVRVH
ncbi:glycoside hydrolase family 43 protein [Bifidobacterium amazonense]|uniref:Glycoside hydrolase family 43 protein n=1 Tax=Bifidobacterium amazonense TaxID=2809027 RepID=A0ABS9VWD8_9BIFI|nr:glycoside hydrolase family 43 protein [Bifidobacterium amazonense]MCH9276388.1 glycoside hydrolase family 43 protein [Bifidobacterium amazonense]